jgi:hypothetical protein
MAKRPMTAGRGAAFVAAIAILAAAVTAGRNAAPAEKLGRADPHLKVDPCYGIPLPASQPIFRATFGAACQSPGLVPIF